MINRFKLTLGVLTCCATMLISSVAFACGYISTCPGLDRFLPSDGVEVPVNLGGIFVRRHIDAVDLDPVLRELDGEEVIRQVPLSSLRPAATDGVLLYEEPLVEGRSYELRSQNSCDPSKENDAVRFTTTESADVPSSLGELELTQTSQSELTLGNNRELCDVDSVPVARADFEIDLDAEALPWRGVVALETLVNGEIVHPFQEWNSSRSLATPNRSTDFIFAACEDGALGGVGEGIHTVQMLGYLPGVSEPIVSNEIEILLECESSRFSGCSSVATNSSRAPGTLFSVIVILLFLFSTKQKAQKDRGRCWAR